MQKDTHDSKGHAPLTSGIRPAVRKASGQIAQTARVSGHPPRVAELLAERGGNLPVWIRAPKGGPEHYCGFSRSKLYDLAAKRAIRSVTVREPGKQAGTRLFELASILSYIETAAVRAEAADVLN